MLRSLVGSEMCIRDRAYLQMEYYAPALADAEAAIALCPGLDGFWLKIRALKGQGWDQEVLKAVREALVVYPEEVDLRQIEHELKDVVLPEFVVSFERGGDPDRHDSHDSVPCLGEL
eukprot:TRINITY_DN23102_c0_g1_i3.p1 TRINITY_DN23102_c0_g1~~TRINITY_DN23102_c0_g1_i3.p1  ORF type:complete len:117 (-),score=39.56 TRINITY_DN23102_c0_g1_i3:370-720(-)